jgi:hypothetical protein
MKKPSPPFSPLKSPGEAKRSITSWTTPEPGDVLSYAYVWHREAVSGQEEGLKDRPVVVVVSRKITDGRIQLLVAPVTHRPPEGASEAIEMPKSVKLYLKLDRERSWIVTTELNQFIWPGPDVRIAPNSPDQSPLIGTIPEWLFERIRASIRAQAKTQQVAIAKRTE